MGNLRSCGMRIRVAAALAAAIGTYACGEGGTEPPPLDPPRPAAVAIAPDTLTFTTACSSRNTPEIITSRKRLEDVAESALYRAVRPPVRIRGAVSAFENA